MGYTDQEATRAALVQLEKVKGEKTRLRDAIASHYREVHRGNWGVDDELWASVGLVADPDVIG